jgi:hypothetical protein
MGRLKIYFNLCVLLLRVLPLARAFAAVRGDGVAAAGRVGALTSATLHLLCRAASGLTDHENLFYLKIFLLRVLHYMSLTS